MNAVPGVRGLFYVRAAALGWYVLNVFLWEAVPRFSGGNLDLFFKLNAIVWLLFEVAELAVAVPFARGRQGTPVEATARALVMLLGVSLFMTVVQDLPELGGLTLFHSRQATEGLYLASRLVAIAAEIMLWLSVTRSLATPSSLGTLFYALLALSGSLALLQLLLPQERYFELVRNPLFHWGRTVIGVSSQALLVVVLKQLLDSGGVATTETTTVPGATSPGRDIAVGALWLGGGLMVTLISYSAASGSGGGRYVVTTGAIAYGLVRLVRGFVRLGG